MSTNPASSATRHAPWSTTSGGAQALETWSISEDTWPSLAARRSLMARSESGDRNRQIASVRV